MTVIAEGCVSRTIFKKHAAHQEEGNAKIAQTMAFGRPRTMVGATAYSLSASAGDGHHAKGPAPLKCADLAAAILDNQGNHDLFQVAFPGKGRDAGPRSRVLAAKSVVIPAGVEPPPFLGGPPGAPYPSYCEVNLTQFPAINVRVEPRTPPTFAVARSLPVATNVPCSGQHPTDMTAPKKKRIGGTAHDT